MRRPPRHFVVEVKSSRRRSLRKPDSIWGDLDLKAVARETEAQVADIRHSGPIATQVANENCTPEPEREDPGQIVAALFLERKESEAAALLEAAIPSESIAAADGVVSKSSELPRNARRAQKPRSKLKITRVPGSTAPPSSADDANLDALMAENDRLKKLLRNKLLRENALLRDMLTRNQ